MASLPTQNVYPKMRDMRWSLKEKAIARRAFDCALHRELEPTIQEASQMAARIKEPDELWELERHLTQRRKRSTPSTNSNTPCSSGSWLT
jgi:hypothetical protein